MARPLRALLVLLATASLLAATAAPAAAADVETSGSREHASQLSPTVDAVLLRPLGIVATVVGSGMFLVSSPFFLATRPQEIHEPFRVLVIRPGVWTWGRPLGHP